MKKRNKSYILFIILISLILTPTFLVTLLKIQDIKAATTSTTTTPATTSVQLWQNVEQFREGAGYQKTTPPIEQIGKIISILLGLLGVIAIIIVIIGGFKWMTAGGNDEKIGGAKKLIGQGIIGLIIVLAAYAIAAFILQQLADKFIHTLKTT